MAKRKQASKMSTRLMAIILTLLTLAACTTEVIDMKDTTDVNLHPNEQMTIIEEDFFKITLPGVWEKISGPDPFVYFNSNDKEALTITIYGRSSDNNDINRSDEFHRLAELRQQAEKELSDSTATFSTIASAEQGETFVARFTASSPDFQSATLLLGVENYIAQFFYEGHGVDEKIFSNNTRTIMNSIILY